MNFEELSSLQLHKLVVVVLLNLITRDRIYGILLFLCRVSSLRLSSVVIPSYAVVGGVASLECHFTLNEGTGGDEESLYALKWYKDGNEFYRYKPRDVPPITSFPLPGVHVNLSSSSLHSVTLNPITRASGGYYKCEVSAEAPSFQTLAQDHLLKILVLPEKGPLIAGLHPWSNIGEVLSLNCSVLNSFPAPSLSWKVNGVEMGGVGSTVDGPHYSTPHPLYSASSLLILKIDVGLVLVGEGGVFGVECVAKWGHSPFTLTHKMTSNIKSTHGLAHYAHTLLNSSASPSTKFKSKSIIIGIITIISVCLISL